MAPFQSSIPVRGRTEWPQRLLLVSGVVPGPKGGVVIIRKALKK